MRKLRLSGSAITIFCISFFLILACNPAYRLIKNQQVTNWENDIRQLEHLDSAEVDPPGAILFAGSSSIKLWENIHEDMKPYQVIQRGYGGANSTDFAYYSKRLIYPHHFNAVVLFIANDITGSKNDRTPEEVGILVKQINKNIRKKYPAVPVFWIQITPTLRRWASWNKISEANEKIRTLCSTSGNTFFISTASSFLGPDGIPNQALFRDDSLHLNKAGYKVWAELIKSNLEKAISVRLFFRVDTIGKPK